MIRDDLDALFRRDGLVPDRYVGVSVSGDRVTILGHHDYPDPTDSTRVVRVINPPDAVRLFRQIAELVQEQGAA